MKISAEKFTLIIITVGLLVFLVVKAFLTPMTHDEACTYFYFTDQNNFKCFFDPSCWSYANNHLLNTILIQLSVGLFEVSNWSIRLPNILGFVLYSVYAIRTAKYLFEDKKMWWLIYLILVLNPFLFDFFLMARGYGLANAFMLPGIYYGLKYINESSTRSLVLAFGCLALSVFSNFVWVLAWAAVWGAVLLLDLVRAGEGKRFNFRAHAYVLALSLILGVLLYTPLTTLSQNAEFKFGVDNLFAGVNTFISASIAAKKYLGDATVNILSYLFWSLYALGMSTTLYASIKKKDKAIFALYFGAILSLVILIQLAQYYLMGVHYLDNRKALIYHPIMVLFVVASFRCLGIHRKVKTALKVVLYVVTALVCYNFFNVIHTDSVREWWYDQYTYEVLNDIEDISRSYNGAPVKLGLKWVYWPSFSFYQRKDSLSFIEEVEYDKKLDTTAYYDYYYILGDEDVHTLSMHYELFKNYGSGSKLLKRKVRSSPETE